MGAKARKTSHAAKTAPRKWSRHVTETSDALDLKPHLIAFQAVAMSGMAMGLSAGALGLGARFADYGEDNPGKLVAGYGGNLNLLASLRY